MKIEFLEFRKDEKNYRLGHADVKVVEADPRKTRFVRNLAYFKKGDREWCYRASFKDKEQDKFREIEEYEDKDFEKQFLKECARVIKENMQSSREEPKETEFF